MLSVQTRFEGLRSISLRMNGTAFSHVHNAGEGRMGGDGTDRRQKSGVALPLCKVSAKEFAVIELFHE